MATTSFRVGDVVFARNASTPGTVCQVVIPGQRYRVLFKGEDFPLFMPHDGLTSAPPGTVGPQCNGAR